jgi:arsenate reductase
MSTPPYRILILCTGNSARSIMGEALANDATTSGGRFLGYSAGSKPNGRVNPLALSTLASHGIIPTAPRSKSWDEFADAGAPPMDFVVTVCDSAAGETCPYWPGVPVSAHWGVPDPPAAGDHAAQVAAFESAFQTLRHRMRLLAALPLEQMDTAARQQALKDIGKALP